VVVQSILTWRSDFLQSSAERAAPESAVPEADTMQESAKLSGESQVTFHDVLNCNTEGLFKREVRMVSSL
jgi:hypothetical protein